MPRLLTMALLAWMGTGGIANSQVSPEWMVESATRCRLSTVVGKSPDRLTVIIQTDFNAPALLKVAILGGGPGETTYSLASPSGRWAARRDTENTGDAANRFKAQVAAGAVWSLRRSSKNGAVESNQDAGNIAQAAAGFDACVAAIPQRRPVAKTDATRPASLQAGLGPVVCNLDARFERGNDVVSLKLVDVPDSSEMIVTGFVRTAEERVGLLELAALGGQNIALDDLPARNDVADKALLRAQLLAGDILRIPVRFTTGDTWTLALGGADEIPTFAVFDSCTRVRGSSKQ